VSVRQYIYIYIYTYIYTDYTRTFRILIRVCSISFFVIMPMNIGCECTCKIHIEVRAMILTNQLYILFNVYCSYYNANREVISWGLRTNAWEINNIFRFE
jgi:hypothetical protein